MSGESVPQASIGFIAATEERSQNEADAAVGIFRPYGIVFPTPTTNGDFLFIASEHGNVNEVISLLEKCTSEEINSLDHMYGNSALIVATDKGHVEVVNVLLSHPDIDVNKKSKYGHTALAWAVKEGRVEVLHALLAHSNINVNVQDNYGSTVLMTTPAFYHPQIASILLSHTDIDVNLQDKEGYTALMHATDRGRADITRLLLQYPGVDVNITNITGETAADIAREEPIRALFTTNNTTITNNTTPSTDSNVENVAQRLRIAAFNGDVPVVDLLLHQCSVEDVNSQSEDGATALLNACKEIHLEVVRTLLTHPGTDVNVQNKDGWTALHYAAKNANIDILQVLMSRSDLKVDFSNDLGREILMHLQYTGHGEMAEAIFSRQTR